MYYVPGIAVGVGDRESNKTSFSPLNIPLSSGDPRKKIYRC